MNIKKSFKTITKHYDKLVEMTNNHLFVGIINEWLLDNYYLIIEQKPYIMSVLKNKKSIQYLNKRVNLYEIVDDILKQNNYRVREEQVIKGLKKYQQKTDFVFLYEELNLIPTIMLIILINKIAEVCVSEDNKVTEHILIDNLIKTLREDAKNKPNLKLDEYIDLSFASQSFIVYFNEQLRELGDYSPLIFKQLNESLANSNLALRDIIYNEHVLNAETSIFVTNAFFSIKQVGLIKVEKILSGVSLIEGILNKDPHYKAMTDTTKAMYRNQLCYKSKKTGIDCTVYAEDLINQGKHVGEQLFKPINSKLRARWYVFGVLFLTALITLFLNYFFLNSKVLGFILLLVPVSEIVIVVLNKLILESTPIKSLLRLDYSKGIPSDQKTMVVVPTIIKNKEKLNQVFNNLEMYYLSNKTNNLYFSLLADCSQEKTEFADYDPEIVEAGHKKVEELNKKYGKNLFYFAYRRRFYNEGEGRFLGHERKRGALLHFNDLVLGRLTEEEKKSYFVGHSFDKFKEDIKYVITLDVDTKLVLNSAKALVGLMAHPLNKPVLNKKGNQVISGYGIMQPKIAIDIDATNKSLFTQIYAGIGGFDPYNSMTPNFYQDVFHEGSFVGKGIYDINVFQQVLKGKFPRNIILSHDLIEGAHIGCANIGDVELVDDFPSKFLIDASRRSRWARGDMQITPWLFKKVKNEKNQTIKNEISLISKFKIFDNIRRGFLDLSLLLILIFGLSISIVHPIWWVLFVMLVCSLPTIFYIIYNLKIRKKDGVTAKYYNVLVYGQKALILRNASVFTSIPFNAYLYISSFIKALYRMYVSKKNLLNWMTAEEAEKIVKSDLLSVTKQFWINFAVGGLVILISVITNHHICISIGVALLLFMGPILAYLMSKDMDEDTTEVNAKNEAYLYEIAKRTWNFFKERMTEENNYLIPDNYQLNRKERNDHKTSPTNIGMSLVSVVSATELKFIDPAEAILLIENVINTIEKLKKWNGHLYNWYDIKTLEVMAPNFISSVDSGNFVVSLITVKEFVRKYDISNPLVPRLEELIKNADFSYLYSDDEVFSVGFNDDEERLEPYSYNKFASEARLISFVAIAKGDVPTHHWFQLDKTLTVYKDKKGLLSWTGTAFEYFMPLIFVKSYPNTLVDESYHFAFEVQRDFMKEIDKRLPWGISESAYNELDDSQNYKYKAFGVPYLRLKEEPVGRIVISPYSSLLSLIKFPREVMNNVKKLRDLGLEGEYGFYESYDAEDKAVVQSYYSHHQGMILASITNYLEDNIIPNYFMNDVSCRTFDILNKEKVQINPIINLKSMKYKKYAYEKERFESDMRVFRHISTTPELSVLSNSKYSVLINDRGNGFSRYRTIQLNRYRKITEQDYGQFLYIKDLDSNFTWSNTYAPMNIKPEKYEVVFNLDRIKFVRSDNEITITTEIVVAKVDHAEIRKITFRNSGKKVRNLELTSYMEPILSDNNADTAHRVYNNMFIKSEYDEETNSIIMKRKSKTSTSTYYLVNRLLIEEPVGTYEYETDRVNFIGRGNSATNPKALKHPLSGYVGTVLDPIISHRNSISIDPGKEKTVYLITGFGKSKDQVMNIVNTYNEKRVINERAFEVATIMANVTNKSINITGADMKIYNTMLNYLYQTSKISINDERLELLKQNKLTQSSLWKFGVSGDRPIMLADISDIEDLSIVKELLHAFEYYKSKSIFVDLVFINSSNEKDAEIISKQIEDEKYHMYAINSFHKIPGNIYVIERKNINPDEYILLSMVARLMIKAEKYISLYQYIEELQRMNTISDLEIKPTRDSLFIHNDINKIDYYNGYGGFVNNGKEYLITEKNTPTIWSNVISNENFGTVVTNNNTGFTFAKNSREFKLTSWTNDTLLNDLSEGVRINDTNINYGTCKHGFGYSEYEASVDDLDILFTTFVAEKDMVKFYKYKIKNTDTGPRTVHLNFFINPTLGLSEDKTGRHILCDYNENKNYVSLRNVYHEGFDNLNVFMSCTNKITDYSIERILFKEIGHNVTIEAGEEVEFAYIMGASDVKDTNKYATKYQDMKLVNQELDNVIKSWENKLGQIQVSTPDKSFDYMLNGWLAYQSLSSRIYAKAGYYQVGGAFGFRDQLQDSMNLCLINPEQAKKQIIINASHQFESGEVLHWWHEHNRLGLRSRYKDDYLWMIYATSEYVRITGDYSILDVKVPYITGEELRNNEMEKGVNFTYTTKKGTLYEHLKKALKKSMNELGSNGIPLMGGGDWNDGMNEIGKKGKGTSVWLGFFLYLMNEKFIEMTNVRYPKLSTKSYTKFNETLKDNLRKNTWDGKYYLRAFFDNGHKVGSKDNDECSIDLISQSFSVLTDIATEDQKVLIFNSIEEKLVDEKEKMVKLLTPAFENNKDNPGYIMDYPVGIRENGGQYTHAVSWYIMALIQAGLKDRAFDVFQMINPINHALDQTESEKYQVEPYVVAADIYSNPDYLGKGGWTWYTGSSAWLYKVGITDILGLTKLGDKLYLKPNVPSTWKSYKMTYKYENTTYNIQVLRDKKKTGLLVDKKLSDKAYIDLIDDMKTHDVVLYLEDNND